MIEARRRQRSFGDGLTAEEIEDLQETWMRHVDAVLQDEAILLAVHQALSNRWPNSSSHGRPGYPAEVVLRLLILKHVSQLELCGSGARSPGQHGVPRLQPRRRW